MVRFFHVPPMLVAALFLSCANPPKSKPAATHAAPVSGKSIALPEQEALKADIIRLLKSGADSQWTSFHLEIDAPPYTNPGFKSVASYFNEKGEVDINWQMDQQFTDKVLNLIYAMNRGARRNQVVFFTRRDDYAKAVIFFSFLQETEEAFQCSLPDSLRGKLVPWYKAREHQAAFGKEHSRP